MLGAVLGGKFSDRVHIPGGAFGSVEFRGSVKRFSVVHTALQPYFVNPFLLPIGEEAHAVRRRFDGIKIVFEFAQRQILVNMLLHLVAGLQIQGYPGDSAECPEADNRSMKSLAVFLARKFHHITGSGDELQPGNRGGQVSILDARAMRCCRAGPGDRNVRQRSQVVQRPAFALQNRAQFSVCHSGLDGHHARLRIQVDNLVHRFHREELVVAVGNVVETVAGAQHLQLALFADKLLHFLHGPRGKYSVGSVLDVPRPVV